VRHRFDGVVGGLCQDQPPGETPCGLNYSASLHYNDDDHPFDAGSPAGGSCVWQMQNLPVGTAGGEYYCFRLLGDPVHQHRSDITVVMQHPVPEPPFPSGRLYGSSADAPAEDGPGELQPPYAAVMKPEFVDSTGKEGSAARNGDVAARAAWALRNGDEVSSGPWPVRQWFCGDGGAPEWWESPGELIAALNVAGEPFVCETWWYAQDRRMVRVQWGVLLGASVEELYAAVESWSTE
jgi:hypothetical protein